MADLHITRTLDAPRHLVWNAWTDPEHIKRWWGPKGFTAPSIEQDLRQGGTYLYCMRDPEGKDYWSTGKYHEVTLYERIVATDSFADEEGNIVPASHYGMTEDFPLELLLTVTFEKADGRTRLTLRHEGFPEGEDKTLAEQGWNESLDKLEAIVRGIRAKAA